MVAFPDNESCNVAGRYEPEGAENHEETEAKSKDAKKSRNRCIVWRNVILMFLLHTGALYAIILIPKAHPFTWIWSYMCFIVTALGVTAGAHRLWSHRSYKAKLPLRIFLAAANSMAFQNDIFEWSRDHRAHHKYSETDADPHNAVRGFFFAHIGWLFVRKHKDVIEKGKRLDVSDLLADPVVVFQRKYYKTSVVVMCFLLPTLVPWYFWGESIWNSYFLASILRYTISLNVAWLVNSAAHMYGNRPYDRNINPRENRFVTLGAIGEGFHNFHHTFPFDYSASEFGLRLNPTTCFIDLMCWLGLAGSRKKATPEMIKARKLRTGDGSA
ncbi:stearoyl-CoA desaturase 5 [Electrophorus electricus]|uniref:stearoyl-CoA desaturase 5 n=1 Tax=Electrophorus electricus TaxID=8005 RepID=UPI000F0A0E48|nr:stearoyl-CoA desaturase 5 [Electrophorus electricus]